MPGGCDGPLCPGERERKRKRHEGQRATNPGERKEKDRERESARQPMSEKGAATHMTPALQMTVTDPVYAEF